MVFRAFLLLFMLLPADAVHAAQKEDLSSQPGAPVDTDIVIRVVAAGAMVLGDEVGGARITITDVETGRLLATGVQHGESGDQNQIMRTPRVMEEPRYTSRPSGSFHATLPLDKPTLVEIAAQGPLRYPAAMKRTSTTVLLMPGHDLTNDGIVLPLYGYIVQIETPSPGQPLMAKDDVKLTASIRTLSGSVVRPHGDWDARKLSIHAEVLIGDRVIERLQMFYAGSQSLFEAPFFVPTPADAPNGIALRVIAADTAGANFGMGQAQYPVVPAQFKSKRN
jgi:hypothetical protein